MQLWNAPKKNRGFTLVEMLAAAVVVSIVAAVAVPNLLGLIYKSNITDGVTDIEGAMKEAQRQAIRFSQSCVIEITLNGGKYVVRPDPAVGGNNNRCLLEQRVLSEGVTVTFDPNIDTVSISSKGSFDYTDPGNPTATNRTITVSHNSISTQKCLRIEGLFGDIQTGIVQGGVCDTN